MARLPQPLISHQRRERAREVSTNRRVQGGSSHWRMRPASGPPSRTTAAAIEPIRVSHPLELVGSLAWLVLVNSIGAVTLLYAMLRHRPASQVSSLIFLSPR